MKILVFFILISTAFASDKIRISSKTFTESYILAEILSQVIEEVGEAEVERRFGLGGSGIVYQALVSEEIDLYPEYTGTIAEAILKRPELKMRSDINRELRKLGLETTESLGFNNTYALGIRESIAKQNNIVTMSDLVSFDSIQSGFSYEFTRRKDGLEGMKAAYGLKLPNALAIEHTLAYQAFENQKIDAMIVYSTDAKISQMNMRLLQDDQSYFPKYLATVLYRKDFQEKFPKSFAAILDLVGTIDEATMRELNAKVDIEGWNFKQAAKYFLSGNKVLVRENHLLGKNFLKYTSEHIYLVSVSMIFAILFSLPLAILSSRFQRLAQPILAATGLLQTIPSLALLCFLIPVFGIGKLTALIALFLYSLLPIVRSTYTGLQSITSSQIESANSLGLNPVQRLWHIELPLASPQILSGIKTSVIINVGTATLAAFIGAGGYGRPIVTGLALNNTSMILQGAIPAAVLALLVHILFELVFDRIFIPKALRT